VAPHTLVLVASAGSESGWLRIERRVAAGTLLATGTLACPECDAPVVPAGASTAPADALACPFCGHAAAVRDFLSLAPPSRPTHVEVHVRPRRRDEFRVLPRS
jgi:hypothetical protein